MKKKLLSLLLVLCMVLSMVPAAMLSVFAEGAASSALPSSTLTPEAVTLPEDGGKVTLPDGWSFVAHGAQQHPDTTAPHNGYETTYVLDTYVAGGIYCTLTGAENGTGTDFAASWDPAINGIDMTRLPSITFNASEAAHVDMGINACVVYTGGYAYEAPETGCVTINLANFVAGGDTTGVGWGGTGETMLALFVDGVMVWPENGTYDDRATWYSLAGNGGQNKTDLVNNGKTVENVYVEAGQSVELLAFHSWWSNPVKADMTVTYTSLANAKPTSSLNREQIKTASLEAGQLVLPEGWSIVQYSNKTYGADAIYLTDFAFDGGWFGQFLLGGTEYVDRNGNSAYQPMVQWNGGNDHPDAGPYMGLFVPAAFVDADWYQTKNAAYSYTAPSAGTVSITIDALRHTVAMCGDRYVAIFVDGVMVWPSSNGSYNTTTSWYYIAQADMIDGAPENNAVTGVRVNEGSKIDFVVAMTDKGYAHEGLVQADLTIAYESLSDGTEPEEPEELPTAVFHRDMVEADENYNLILPDGWELIARKSDDYANKVALTTIYSGSDAMVGPNQYGESWIFSPELGWGTSPNVPWFNKTDNDWCWGAWMGLGPNDVWSAGYAYTAEYVGTIDIVIDAIRDLNMRATDWEPSDTKYFAVFVDGQMVWPTAGGDYNELADWVAADKVYTESDFNLLKNIPVSLGQTVEFLAKGTLNSDAVSVDLTIQYVDVLADAKANASVVLGEKFAVQFEVVADELASESGIYIDGQKSETFAKTDIIAADLSAPIYYTPYQVVNGVEVKADTKSISVLEILALYTAENGYDEATVALAEAITNYAYAAEAYFYEFPLEDAVKAAIDALAAPEAKNAKITDAIDETATFVQANIYLNDAMDMKVFFKADGATDPTLKVEGAGDDITVTVEKAGSTYIALIEDIPMSAYGNDLKITVYDGETAISETLTYGVEIYAARTFEADADTALNDLLKAIVNLGKAAAAYNA